MKGRYYRNIGKAVYWTKNFEALLEEIYNAEGVGLHEKVNDIQDHVNSDILKKLKYVATIRNKLAHEIDYNELEEDFEKTCKEIQQFLGKEKKRLHYMEIKLSFYKKIGRFFQSGKK